MLNIAIISHDIVWGDKEENLLLIDEKLRNIKPEVDIVVLPEMFSTGFIQDGNMIASLAEPSSGKTLEFIKQQAKKYNFAICGSFIASIADKYYNRAFFIEPSGDETFYDKHHRFSIGQEKQAFQAGESKYPIIRYRGWNIALSICYDIRFPVWCRNSNLEYDIMIIPANWPDSRAFAWEHLLIARAIENQAYIIGANRSGSDDNGKYSQKSYTFDFYGHNAIKHTENNIMYAQLSHQALDDARQKFPVWKDADKFILL